VQEGMRITTKGRYGLTMMMELARRFGEGPSTLKSIAEKHHLSEHYLEQLVTSLRHNGLVRSVRGAHGGYILQKNPQEITSGEIIKALEGPLSPVDFTEEDDPAKRFLWMKIRDSIADVLNSVTLHDLITFDGDQVLDDGYMFYI